MTTERNRMVRERAYALWVENGRHEGRSDEHWLQAEREIDADAAQPKAKRERNPAKSAASPAKTGSGRTAAPATDPTPKGGRTRARAGNAGAPAR